MFNLSHMKSALPIAAAPEISGALHTLSGPARDPPAASEPRKLVVREKTQQEIQLLRDCIGRNTRLRKEEAKALNDELDACEKIIADLYDGKKGKLTPADHQALDRVFAELEKVDERVQNTVSTGRLKDFEVKEKYRHSYYKVVDLELRPGEPFPLVQFQGRCQGRHLTSGWIELLHSNTVSSNIHGIAVLFVENKGGRRVVSVACPRTFQGELRLKIGNEVHTIRTDAPPSAAPEGSRIAIVRVRRDEIGAELLTHRVSPEPPTTVPPPPTTVPSPPPRSEPTPAVLEKDVHDLLSSLAVPLADEVTGAVRSNRAASRERFEQFALANGFTRHPEHTKYFCRDFQKDGVQCWLTWDEKTEQIYISWTLSGEGDKYIYSSDTGGRGQPLRWDWKNQGVRVHIALKDDQREKPHRDSEARPFWRLGTILEILESESGSKSGELVDTIDSVLHELLKTQMTEREMLACIAEIRRDREERRMEFEAIMKELGFKAGEGGMYSKEFKGPEGGSMTMHLSWSDESDGAILMSWTMSARVKPDKQVLYHDRQVRRLLSPESFYYRSFECQTLSDGEQPRSLEELAKLNEQERKQLLKKQSINWLLHWSGVDQASIRNVMAKLQPLQPTPRKP